MNNIQTKYYFSYTSEYSEIYESAYGTGFVFVDQEDELPDEQINDLDSLVTPPFFH